MDNTLIEQAVERLLPKTVVEKARRDRAADIQAKRERQAAAWHARKQKLQNEIRAFDPIIAKHRDAEKQLDKARHEQAVQTARVVHERFNVIHQLQREELEHECAMRSTASAIIQSFVPRVDEALKRAVPDAATFDTFDSMGLRHPVTVSGNADARRKALYMLRRDIQQRWCLEPLSDEQFQEKFERAIAMLPALVPPPTLEAFLAEANKAGGR